jgi:squalene-hopene/tetraprenyl-beta-curcumene cyclase
MGTLPRNSQTLNQPAKPRYGRIDIGLDLVAGGINKAKDWLLGEQDPEGYWCGELEADVMLEADYIYMHFIRTKTVAGANIPAALLTSTMA